jgi:hypothetical protein
MPFPTITVKDSSDVVRTINTQPSSGRVAAAESNPVTLSNEDKAVLDAVVTTNGAVTETVPASDTASSGLNGRLQRIAQRITSLIALLPTALGVGGGLKVDGSGTALPVKTLLAQGVSRALTTTGTSANQTLTVGIKAITIYSRGSDAYIQVGNNAQTATTASMFIGSSERLDLDVSGFANPAIAILQGPSTTSAVLQITELS